MRLKAAPDWSAAAQLVVDGCVHGPDAAYRVELLERLAGALGDALYPAFVQVLAVIGERGTPAVQAAVAEALVDALRAGRLPAGRRSAWGAGARGSAALGAALGPVEYLCAWYADPGAADAPSALRFDGALRALLALLSSSPRAQSVYATRLVALADDAPEGTLSRAARAVLRAVGTAWSGGDASSAADAAQEAQRRVLPPSLPPLRLG